MTTNNTSTNVPGQPSQGDATTNTPANVATSTSQGDQSTSTLEALQQQLADAQTKLAKFEEDNFKAREKERLRKQEQQAQETQRQEELRQKGEYETLAKTLQSTVDELKAQIAQRDQEIAKRDYEALRAKVAATHGLAPDLAIRLTGQTEDELSADAKKLKELIGEQTSLAQRPGNGPGPKPAGQLTQAQQTEETIKRQRATGHYRVF